MHCVCNRIHLILYETFLTPPFWSRKLCWPPPALHLFTPNPPLTRVFINVPLSRDRREQTTCSNVLQYHDYLESPWYKRFPLSTNMPSFGSIICEIGFGIYLRNVRKQNFVLFVIHGIKPMAAQLSMSSIHYLRCISFLGIPLDESHLVWRSCP